MKYATLVLGAVLLLASIITARAQIIARCDYPPGRVLTLEENYVPTCPASTPREQCLSVRLDGYKIGNAPLYGFDLRIKTQTPPRGVSTSGPDLVAVMLNGKSCRLSD